MSTTKFTDFLKEKLKDKDFREVFLAEKAKVPQSTIARIESGQNTSVATMNKIAFALDKSLTITIE